MVKNVFVGEANGGRIIQLEVGVDDLGLARGSSTTGALAEDTFAGTQVDIESHTPTGNLTVKKGFGGWTYNNNGAAPGANNVCRESSWVANTNGTGGPYRGRCTTDIGDDEIKVYAGLYRCSTDTNTKTGIRVLIDGSENEDTEKDGVDVVFERVSSTQMRLWVREWIDGVETQTKEFFSDAQGSYWAFGVSTSKGLVVEVDGNTLKLTVCDAFGDGVYTIANSLTLYNSGGSADNEYTLSQSRTNKRRVGWIVQGNPTSGRGAVMQMYVESTSTEETGLSDDFIGPDFLWKTKPYTPLGESGICVFRRIFLAIKHSSGFEILVIPYVDGVELVKADGTSQKMTITVEAPERPTVTYIEVPIVGRGTSLSWKLVTGQIAGDLYVEGAAVGYEPVRRALLD